MIKRVAGAAPRPTSKDSGLAFGHASKDAGLAFGHTNKDSGLAFGHASKDAGLTFRSIKKNDMLLFAFILLAGISIAVLNTAFYRSGEKVTVFSGRDVYGIYALGTDRQIIIDDGVRFNAIVISNGTVKMKEANCANGDCLAQHPINKTRQTIVCLPNQILISIEGIDNPSGADSEGTNDSSTDSGGVDSREPDSIAY